MKVRVWDLPTRLFHWALAACVVGLVVTGKVGGNAMLWHFRLGYAVLALVLFRIVWGLVGGHWSRFASFLYGPGTLAGYLSGRAREVAHEVGHSPLGSLSVFAMLLVLAAQATGGLFADDEIANLGPLAKFIDTELSLRITWYHKAVGQWLVIGLVALHVLAIVSYALRGRPLVGAMIHGDKTVAQPVPASRDTAGTRLLALVVLAACAGVVAWVVSLGG
jgi:cytochrome b